MSWVWRLLLTVYNLLLIALGAVTISMAAGNSALLAQFDSLFATPYSRMFSGIIGGFLLVCGVLFLVLSLRRSGPSSLLIQDSPFGEVCITNAAISEIIMKVARGIDGVREVRPAVSHGKKGIIIYLHLMVRSDTRLPELTALLQDEVRDQVENLAGIKVQGVRILVDEPSLRRAR